MAEKKKRIRNRKLTYMELDTDLREHLADLAHGTGLPRVALVGIAIRHWLASGCPLGTAKTKEAAVEAGRNHDA